MMPALSAARRKAAALALVSAVPFAFAPAQSYPKLATSGHGLALTRFSIQERQAGSWVASPSLRQGVDYRIVWRFTNYFPDIGFQYGAYVTDIIHLTFYVEGSSAGGMTFYTNDAYSGTANKPFVGVDEAGLRPTQSRTYYQHFRWSGPPTATPLKTFTVDFRGAEVHWLPLQYAPIRPS